EVVLAQVVGDLLAGDGSLNVGGSEVDSGPNTGVDDLLECRREALEAPRWTGCGRALVAGRGEGDLVGAEERLERVHGRPADTSVARRGVGKPGRDQRGSRDGNGRVEQRQPVSVGRSRRVA